MPDLPQMTDGAWDLLWQVALRPIPLAAATDQGAAKRIVDEGLVDVVEGYAPPPFAEPGQKTPWLRQNDRTRAVLDAYKARPRLN